MKKTDLKKKINAAVGQMSQASCSMALALIVVVGLEWMFGFTLPGTLAQINDRTMIGLTALGVATLLLDRVMSWPPSAKDKDAAVTSEAPASVGQHEPS